MININKFRPQSIMHVHILTQLMGTGLLELPYVGVEFPGDARVKVVDRYGHYSLFECDSDDNVMEVERG